MSENFITQDYLDKILENFNNVERQVSGSALECTLLEEDAVLFKIKGRVIGNTSAEIMFNDVCKGMMEVTKDVIFDLSECPYLSSFFLGSIMQLVISHKKNGLSIIFSNINEIIEDLIGIANINNLIVVADSVEEAIEHLKK